MGWVGLIIGLLIYFSIAAMVLTSACSLARVQQPDFFFAMVLVFFILMAVGILGFAAGLAATLGAGIPLTSLRTVGDLRGVAERGSVMGLISIPFISAWFYSVMLRDCSYLRGLLIWVMQYVVIILFLLALYLGLNALGLTGKHA